MDDLMESAPPRRGQWLVADIIYITLVTPLLLAAFVEWFLWLAAFLFGLVNVYRKAEHWTTRVIAVFIMTVFSILRSIFLPVMIVTLPLPTNITSHFSWAMVNLLQWFAFYTFSVLLLVPWALCIYRLVTNEVGRAKRIEDVLHDTVSPKVVVVMPVYNEEPEVLIRAIRSVVGSDYPSSCLHVFLSFDGEPYDALWDTVCMQLGIPLGISKKAPSIDTIYHSVRVTVSRFPHGGKRHCQKRTFKLIDRIYADYLSQHDDLFLLFIDSDCILDKVCIQNFMYDMELKPGSTHDMVAMTGIITSTTETMSLLTILQDMEYIHGQLFERSVESTCGSVTCLPGALTMLRFSAFRKMAKYYFEDQIDKIDNFFDYIKCHLGEDRWLTHLFMVSTVKRNQIQLCTGAFCKTQAVQTMSSLIKQRRRWFLGFISNEVCMLTDVRIWRRYPLLCIIRFMQDTIRTTALLFFIMILSVSTTSTSLATLPLGFIAISLGLNYALMLYFGYILHRFKAWLYPLMFLLNPFFNWLYLVYGCCTAGKRTWGGPRTNAPKADEHTTPREAAEQAEAQGDDLNVDVSTFREYGHAAAGVPLHPAESVTDRLAVDPSHSGPRDARLESELSLMRHDREESAMPRIPLHPRTSFDSATTDSYSVTLPRPVESLIEEIDRIMQEIRDPDKQTLNSDKEEQPTTPDWRQSFRNGNNLSFPGRQRNFSPQSSPAMSTLSRFESASTDVSPDPVRQLTPLHITPSPLGQSCLQNTVPEDDNTEQTISCYDALLVRHLFFPDLEIHTVCFDILGVLAPSLTT
ncbi:chitin synthase D [Talaromyces stipitatus ATCC 10500]|uniref:chitin synthase n=1 Tax=Talaromyces stipitatus (strain ATCC 10500 / CBS 375.48 / QM 6759 / NRRL 1006) TaxID=441959 RepID=B8M2F9_TALSN|nr:chitin synthase D [Talaromyces stipitatus ATCC 10500]EED21623.1 chitin synthase D [Talaromyces stipitatus ATCC 10500]